VGPWESLSRSARRLPLRPRREAPQGERSSCSTAPLDASRYVRMYMIRRAPRDGVRYRALSWRLPGDSTWRLTRSLLPRVACARLAQGDVRENMGAVPAGSFGAIDAFLLEAAAFHDQMSDPSVNEMPRTLSRMTDLSDSANRFDGFA